MMRLVVGSCETTQERLSDHLDRELHGLRRLAVVRHLFACPHCRAVLDSLARTITRLRELGGRESVPTSPAFVEAVVERVQLEPRGGDGG
jgi:predicted anti-sigma-YlaC factor YlaD